MATIEGDDRSSPESRISVVTMSDHLCPVVAGAGGLIDDSWCFDRMAEVLVGMPPIVTETDVLRPELLLFENGRLSVRYCPFDSVNPKAKLVIVGITPGLRQMFLSCQEAQRALTEGQTGGDVIRRAKAVGGFAGSMRTNLVTMLDGIGLHEKLGIDSTRLLFGEHGELLSGTSAIIYPAFVDGRNYTGTPGPEAYPLLQAFVDQVLTASRARGEAPSDETALLCVLTSAPQSAPVNWRRSVRLTFKSSSMI
jgi:hypothetical protein